MLTVQLWDWHSKKLDDRLILELMHYLFSLIILPLKNIV